MILTRLPNTVQLAVASLIVTLIGIPLGVIAATNRNTLTDLAVTNLALVGLSVPNFWLGLLLIVWFSVDLRWFPAAGLAQPGGVLPDFSHWSSPPSPSESGGLALIARLTRSGMLEVLGQEYVRTATAKGLARRRVVYGHALKNALIPVITVLVLNFGYLLGGAVVTESVFAINGVGRLAVDSILSRDYAVVQGCVIFIASTFVLVNLLVDLSYALLDPQISYT